MQASEGNIIEVSGQKRRNLRGKLTFDGLMDDELSNLGAEIKQLQFDVNDKKSVERDEPDG